MDYMDETLLREHDSSESAGEGRMSSLVAQKSSMNRRTLMRQNLRRSVQPTNPHQGQVSRSVTKEKNKEQIKQRAIKEMTKTWESSTSITISNKRKKIRSKLNSAL